MKTNKLNTILSGISVVAIAATFLFLIAKAVNFSVANGDVANYIRGYDLIFGNDAYQVAKDGLPAFIAVFVFLIVGGVFSLLTSIFTSLGDENTSHKFVSFLSVIGGLLMAASAVLFFLAPMFYPADVLPGLNWGAIACGACAAVAAVTSLVSGVKGLLVK